MTDHDPTTHTSNQDFADFVKEHGSSMYHHALSRSRTPEAAQDVVQEVFCRLRTWITRLEDQGDTPRSLKAMGWSILRNRLIDENRRVCNRNHHDIERAGGNPVRGLATAYSGQRSARYETEVRRAYRVATDRLRALSPKLRDAFEVVELNNRMSQQQYADAHGISQATVSRMLTRARAILRENLTLPGAPTHEGTSPLQRRYCTVE